MERFTIEELKGMKTISEGWVGDLKYEDDDHRVWLSRLTIEDGAEYNNQVIVEIYEGGEWVIVDKYQAL